MLSAAPGISTDRAVAVVRLVKILHQHVYWAHVGGAAQQGSRQRVRRVNSGSAQQLRAAERGSAASGPSALPASSGAGRPSILSSACTAVRGWQPAQRTHSPSPGSIEYGPPSAVSSQAGTSHMPVYRSRALHCCFGPTLHRQGSTQSRCRWARLPARRTASAVQRVVTSAAAAAPLAAGTHASQFTGTP